MYTERDIHACTEQVRKWVTYVQKNVPYVSYDAIAYTFLAFSFTLSFSLSPYPKTLNTRSVGPMRMDIALFL